MVGKINECKEFNIFEGKYFDDLLNHRRLKTL